MEEHLTPRQVAEALRVSESSVKRWCDSGAIPTIRTMGGHRRIPLVALMEFLEKNNRQLLNPAAIQADDGNRVWQTPNSASARPSVDASRGSRQVDLSDHREKFVQAILGGDERTARKALLDSYAACESVAVVADSLIAMAFQEIGAMWSCDQIDVYHERRSCEICSRLIHEFRRLIGEPASESPLAIGGSPEGDLYSLPSQIVELVLREGGWRASNLGSNLPFKSLLAAAVNQRPKLFWISVSAVEDEERFVKEFSEFSNQLPRDVALVVGGRGLHDRLRPRLRFSAHCDNMVHLSEFSRVARGHRPTLEASKN